MSPNTHKEDEDGQGDHHVLLCAHLLPGHRNGIALLAVQPYIDELLNQPHENGTEMYLLVY